MRICGIAGCTRKHCARGYCTPHYRKLRKSGALEVLIRPSATERFWSKVEKTDSCWNWRGGVLRDGYGMFPLGQTSVLAHRFGYQDITGTDIAGLQLDHICHNRRCVRPEHLRITTQKQNAENLTGAHRDSKSGVRGVHWVKRRRRWRAVVGHLGKAIHVGEFKTLAEAESAARQKRNDLYTHNDADRETPCHCAI